MINGKHAVGYVRVSGPKQIKGTSIGEQKRRIKAHCVSQEFKFLRFYTDKGTTGAVKQRPEFQQMLADAKAGVFNVLVVLAIDRLSRNLHHFLETFDDLKELGIGLVLVTQPVDTESDLGDFTIKLLSLLADFERKTIRARTKGGRVASFKKGDSFPGTPPYGYDWEPKKKIVFIDEDRAKIYRQIVDMYLNSHLSTTRIAENLTDLGIETPGSRLKGRKKLTRWADDMVRRILHNTAYYGEATYLTKGYEIAISESGKPYHKKVDKPNDSDPITIKFPPLISRDKWDHIQKQIEYNKRKPKKIRKKDAIGKFLTSNTLGKHFVCDLCGSQIRARTYYDKRADKTRFQYGCTRHLMSTRQLKSRNKEKCPLPAISADVFDSDVWDTLARFLSNPQKFSKAWIIPEKNTMNIEKEIKQLEKQKNKRLRELDNITDSIAETKDKLSRESHRKKQYKLAEEIERIEAEIDVKQRDTRVSTDSIIYIEKLVREAEEAVDEVQREGKQQSDVDDIIIPTIYGKLRKLKIYDVRKEVLEAVVSPEQGGVVKMAFDFDDNYHFVELDAKLNYLRTVRIIKAIKGGTLVDGTFFNPNYFLSTTMNPACTTTMRSGWRKSPPMNRCPATGITSAKTMPTPT